MQAMVHPASVGSMHMEAWSLAHMLSEMVPVNVRVGATCRAATARRLTTRSFVRAYCPGIIRWAVVVPAFMMNTPPPRPFSGSPSEAPVAPGTAMVMWCGEM